MPEFRLNFELLLDQYKKDKDSFSVLSKAEIFRLKSMDDTFRTGSFSPFSGSSEKFVGKEIPHIPRSEIPHAELVREIYRKKATLLEPYTGLIDDCCQEYPVLDGSLDLMIRAGRTAWVIEVKTDRADHAIIGQVMKYLIGLSLLLPLNIFDEVRSLTLCPGYDRNAFDGLTRIGAIPLLLDPAAMTSSVFS